MSNQMNSADLYKEFLSVVGLRESLFSRILMIDERKMKKSEKLLGATIGGVQIPVHHGMKNAYILMLEIELAAENARRVARKLIKREKGIDLDIEYLGLICGNLVESILREILWPLEFLTIEAELNREQFEPLAAVMESMVYELFDITDNVYYSFSERSEEIRRDAREHRQYLDRMTDSKIASAPVYIRATGKVHDGLFGPYLDIQAHATSSMSQADIITSYMANDYSERFDIERGDDRLRDSIYQYLEDNIYPLVDGFKQRFLDALNSIPPIYMVYRPAMYNTDVASRPFAKENIIKIFYSMTKREEFSKMKAVMEFYEFDFKRNLEKEIFGNFMNHYKQYGNFDYDNIDLKFYLYYHKSETPIECEEFYGMFKEEIKKLMRERCFELCVKDRKSYEKMSFNDLFADIMEMVKAFPDMDNSHELSYNDIGYYIYYDVMGSMEKNKYDKDGNNIPVFIYDYEEKEEPKPEPKTVKTLPQDKAIPDKLFRSVLAQNNLSENEYTENLDSVEPFVDPEKHYYVVIADKKIPANDAVSNTRDYLYYLITENKKVTANTKEAFDTFKNYSLVTKDNVDELCDVLYREVLKYQLKSIHYFTVESRLTKDIFAPVEKFIQKRIDQLNQVIDNIRNNYYNDLNTVQLNKDTTANAESEISTVIAEFGPFFIGCIYNELAPNRYIDKETLGFNEVTTRPYLTKHTKEIFHMMTKEDEFKSMDYFFWYYDVDFETMFGEEILNNYIEHYKANGNFDYKGIDLEYYLHYYEAISVTECVEFEDLFSDYVTETFTERCTELYQRDKYTYAQTDCEEFLADIFEMLNHYPFPDEELRESFLNKGRYIFYDTMGSSEKEKYAIGDYEDDEYSSENDEW